MPAPCRKEELSMKTVQKLLSLLLTLCLFLTLLSGLSGASAAESGRVIELTDDGGANNLRDAVENARDGDTIKIMTVGRVNSATYDGTAGTSDPWVIDKEITILGAASSSEIYLRTGGIVLGKDVTFQNIKFSVANPVRNAIFANGRTLTLRNVSKTQNSWDLHLFCGGVTGLSAQAGVPAPGSAGKIIIQGSTSLDNLYAGSISADGADNAFTGSAEIVIDSGATGSMGTLYAGGALQTPVDDHWFDYVAGGAAVAPPTAAPAKFKATGNVSVKLFGSVVRAVYGATGGASNAAVTFDDNSGLPVNRSLSDLGSLSVRTGILQPAKLTGDGLDLSVSAGASLQLISTDTLPVIGDFSGGGSLVLKRDQTLRISGAVTGGATKLYMDGSRPDGSSLSAAIKGHAYLNAPNSKEGDFSYAPNGSGDTLRLLRSDTGIWTAAGDSIDPQIIDFSLPGAFVFFNPDSPGDIQALEIPAEALFVDNGAPVQMLGMLPVEISVNNTEAEWDETNLEYRYSVAPDKLLCLYFSDDGSDEVLTVHAVQTPTVENGLSGEQEIAVPAGNYTITVTVPAECTEQNAAIARTVELTVFKGSGSTETDPVAIKVSVPKAITGLTYTGSPQTGVAADIIFYNLSGHQQTDAGDYTAVASLVSPGYQWSDGVPGNRQIPWTIAKAEGPAAPEGLAASAPLASGGNGRIMGTSASMEYSATADFASVSACGDLQTEVPAGTYYIREKLAPGESYKNYNVHYATVTVPAYAAPSGGGTGEGGGTGGDTPAPIVPSTPSGPEDPGKEPVSSAEQFIDVDQKAWYYEGVSYCVENGLMAGCGNGVFAPGGTLSRSQLVQILYNKDEKPDVVKKNDFIDIKPGAWYENAVLWAAEHGIVSGYGHGFFGPGDPVTREQAVAILYRYAQHQGAQIPPVQEGVLDRFRDAGKLSSWAKAPMEWAVSQGILSGKTGGLLDPQGSASRAEAASLIQRFCEKMSA